MKEGKELCILFFFAYFASLHEAKKI